MSRQRQIGSQMLGNHRSALFNDLLCQPAMAAWVDICQPTAQYRNGNPFSLQGGTVTDPINTNSQTAGDGETAMHQPAGKVSAPLLAIVAELAATHHGNLR
ncbi:hypothetical protein D3C75_1055690 [compost metagenome]